MDDEIKKPSFLVYYDNEIIVLRLPDDEAGKLFKSLFPYGRESIKPDFDRNPALAMAFDILSMAIDRDKEKYVNRCEKNRENVKKRWSKTGKQSNTNVCNDKQSNTNYTDKDMDKDMDKDSINTISPEPDKSAPDPSGIKLPLNDKTYYDVPLSDIELWKDTYPAADVEGELKRMIAWLESNPTKKKTRRGITRFINSWLSRTQDRGGSRTGQQAEETNEQAYEMPDFYKNLYAEHYKNYVPGPEAPFQ